jgi:hypothetical protein
MQRWSRLQRIIELLCLQLWILLRKIPTREYATRHSGVGDFSL